VDYGQWAGLSQSRADRYSIYRWRLKKTELVAAGDAGEGEDAESLLSDDGGSSESGTSTSGASGTDDQNKAAVRLMRFTLTIFRQSKPDEALATLTRYLPPPDFQGAATK